MKFAMAAHHEWNLLPTKGVFSGSVTGIRQAPDELFQDFVDRLLKQLTEFLEILRQKIH